MLGVQKKTIINNLESIFMTPLRQMVSNQKERALASNTCTSFVKIILLKGEDEYFSSFSSNKE